ncbi:phage major capsid protein [Alloscardovia theropitheci]|uniref:Phage major capsid protein n=1 Tax=Alloscardovia theropitheci TaxID=2496842 RepID=A0A4R0QRT2_9BIFI|nr:phage major capsid protein [Alloscardovia theropitheci]TCD53765.1 phage major capsid protein [Alloscardovia theropitheci]
MVALATGKFNLPNDLVSGVVSQVTSGSAVGKLSAQKPMRFGKNQLVTFTTKPRAEFVEEGGDKAPTPADFGTVVTSQHKAQVTMRFDEEVLYADEDYQIGVLSELANGGQSALARALDLGVFYRLNPLTGGEVSSWTNYLNATTNRVAATSDFNADLQKAIGMVLSADDEGYPINGMALTPTASYELATASDKNNRPLYPELGFGVGIESFKSVPVSVTTTVNPPEATTKPNVKGIVGDFQNGVYWGIQRQMPVELISTGDPDGLGDLKCKNQIALRMEMYYAWYVFEKRFAVIASTSGASSSH